MALTSYPFENAATTESQYTKLFRNFADTGIVGNYGDTAFNVTTDGSGLDVQVAPGYAIVRGHAVENDAPLTVTHAAADPALPRIDVIVLRLVPLADGITVEIKQGTPAANPITPGLTQTDVDVYELEIARVTIPAGALNIVSTNITSHRTWTGDVVGVWSNSNRPTNIVTGKLGYNVDLKRYESWDGAKWNIVGVTTKKITIPHTFTLSGLVSISNTSDTFISPFYLPEPAGQTVRLMGVRHKVHHPGASGSVSWRVRKSSVNGEPFATLIGDTSTGAVKNSVMSPQAMGDLDEILLEITGIVGEPKNLTVTLFFEYEV